MSSNSLNSVYKTGILAVEEASITADLTHADGTDVAVSCKVMTTSPFVVGNTYVIRDDTWTSSSGSGVPNAERVLLKAIDSDATAIPLADGIGYTYTATLQIAGFTTSGYTGSLKNDYTSASATILIPGVEMAIQSSDFNCRFKTLTDAPKIEMDDEASRFASGDEGREKSIPGARSGEINFVQNMAWAGNFTTVPVWGKIMRTCGHVIKKYAGTGVEFLPHVSGNEVTATIWILNPENGYDSKTTCYRYSGCHGGSGSSVGAAKIGDAYKLTVKYNGAYIGQTDFTVAQGRALTSADTNVAEILLSNTCVVPAIVNGVTTTKEVEISQFALDFGGVVNPFIDQSTTTGYAYYATQDRDPKLSINPYMTLKSVDDWDYIVTNATTGTVLIKSAITAPHITVEVPNAQLMSPAIASREGYINTNRTYRCLRNNLSTVVDSAIADGIMYSILVGTRS
jgi:hypothetical protein